MTDLAADPRVIDAEAPQYNARLIRRVDETDSLAYFFVRFDGEPTPFEPGQYMTIGVMVEGKLIQRPVFGGVAAGRRRRRGLRVLCPAVQGGTFTPLLWRMPVGQRHADDRPEGQVHAAAGRRPDPHLHLVGHGQRAVRVDDAPAPGRRGARAGRSSSTACRTRTSWAIASALEDWEASGDYPVTYVPTVSRPTDPANAGWMGRTGRVEIDPRAGARRARARLRRIRSPTSAATRT